MSQANTEHIVVLCVNSHDALVAACEAVLTADEEWREAVSSSVQFSDPLGDALTQLRAALALAKVTQ